MRTKLISFLTAMILAFSAVGIDGAVRAQASAAAAVDEPAEPVLSPFWGPGIQRWADYVGVLADVYGFDPDFVAAVIQEESNGDPTLVSRVGAVGLMGVMPTSPGLEWRPPAEELTNPATNLRWGVAILSEIVRQSGGDLFAALAAYSGGWDQADRTVPRQYAARVLDNYGRAIVMRDGGEPDIASQWTLAVEIRHGHMPQEPLLVLGDEPVSGLRVYSEHMVYHYVDRAGQAYYVKGYAVPLALVVPLSADADAYGNPDAVPEQLQARLGENSIKIANSNPRVIIACLPSLSRLRGRASTRWYAPSYCPSWHR